MTEQEANPLKMDMGANAVGGRLREDRVVRDLGPGGRVDSYSIAVTDPFTGVLYRMFNFEEWELLDKALTCAFDEEDRRR